MMGLSLTRSSLAALVSALAIGPILCQSDVAPIAATRHEVTLDGQTLRYTVHAGLLPIRLNETGEVRGSIFFTYYGLDRDPGSPPRPLTFLWNGGPGANSVLVHLVGFGPMTLQGAEAVEGVSRGDLVLGANRGTWLESTDLVFVDPIGTGFSRPTRPEYAEEFYGAREDASSIAEFVRLFVTRFDAWDAPLFIGGESYGTWRAAGVTKILQERGVPVAGVLLISGGIPIGTIEQEEMRVAHLITTRTAAAFHHRRLAPDLLRDLTETLRQAEEWATGEYAPALAEREGLSDEERRRVAEGLARYTGLRIDQIDSEALVINRQEFADELLADRGVQLARFDTRETTGQASRRTGARAALVGRYLRVDLGFHSETAYQGLERGYRSVTDSGPVGPGARWKYNHGSPGELPPVRLTVGDGPPGGRPGWLGDALELNPSIKVFVAAGLFDSLNSCSLNRHLVSLLPPPLRDNFTLACYPGGHMMYEDRDILLRMKADVARFIQAAIADVESEPPSRSRRGREDGLAASREVSMQDSVVTTSHAIQLDGRELPYTVRAGRLPIRDNQTEEVRAKIFFVAYSVEPAEGEPARPVLFAWNGGPGSNAGLSHVTAMGPRRLRMGDVYATADPGQMSAMVDNEGTWLGATDLVFVDPVGTGYSRPTEVAFGPEFYDTEGDVESLAEFIRVYRVRFDAWDSPLLIAGESYGSLRAAAVTRSLQRKGIQVAGIVFISGSPGLGRVPNHLRAPLLLPALTASALYHGKLPGELTDDPERTLVEARRWALEEYADALLRLERLTPAERASVARGLARFTGLPVERIKESDLAVAASEFSEGLLYGEGRVLGRYDARLSRDRKTEEGIFDPREDASLAPFANKITGNSPTMQRYFRRDLGYENDLYYIGPFGGAWPPPTGFRGDWMSVRWNRRNGPPEPLRDAMEANPDLRVLHASGRYDLVTPAGPPAYLIDQLEPDLKTRITVKVYEGGHSFYLDRASRLEFMRDGAELIEAAAAAARRQVPAP